MSKNGIAPEAMDPVNYPAGRLLARKIISGMKKLFFRLLVKLNNLLLPKYSGKDPATLKKGQLLILGFRYWALKNAL